MIIISDHIISGLRNYQELLISLIKCKLFCSRYPRSMPPAPPDFFFHQASTHPMLNPKYYCFLWSLHILLSACCSSPWFSSARMFNPLFKFKFRQVLKVQPKCHPLHGAIFNFRMPLSQPRWMSSQPVSQIFPYLIYSLLVEGNPLSGQNLNLPSFPVSGSSTPPT